MTEPHRGSGAGRSRDPATLARLRVLLRARGFRALIGARTISQFGDGIFQVAAASVLLFQDPGENPAAGLFALTAATLIPFSVIGPFVGVFIDRWDRQLILSRVPLGRAAVAALLPVAALAGTHSVWFYAVTLVVLSANRFFLATSAAVLPSLVEEDDLLTANSVATTGGSIANVTGLGIGSVASSSFGGEQTALIAAAAFALAAFAARFIPVHRASGDDDQRPLREDLRAVLRDLRAGARAMASSRRVRYGMSSIVAVQLLVGATVGVLTYYIIHVLGLQVGASAGLLSLLAIGIGVGVVLVPFVGRRVEHDLLVPIGFAVGALGAFVGGAFLSRDILLVSAWLMGLSYAFAKIPVDTIVQEEMQDIVRGRAFAFYDMLFNFARVTGVGLVAVAYARGSTSKPLIVAIGVAFAAGAVALLAWEKGGHMWKRRKASVAPALEAGELVSVRAYAGSRADEEPRAIVSGGREIPIDSIDWRAVVEEGGRRSRVFVVRVAGQRVRLAHRQDAGWEIERVTAVASPPDQD
jgi:MFS family permease